MDIGHISVIAVHLTMVEVSTLWARFRVGGLQKWGLNQKICSGSFTYSELSCV